MTQQETQLGIIRHKRIRRIELGLTVLSRRKDILDLTGQKFNRLTVLSLAPIQLTSNNNAHWLCRCECGTEKIVRGTRLRSGEIKSCGCYRRIEHMAWLRSKLGKNK